MQCSRKLRNNTRALTYKQYKIIENTVDNYSKRLSNFQYTSIQDTSTH